MRKWAYLLLLVFSFWLCACSGTEYKRSDFFAMDTYAFVIADTDNEKLLSDVKDEVLRIEKTLSATFIGSEIKNIFSENTEISHETRSLLEKADEISRKTDGLFDYTLGQLIKLWDINGGKIEVPDDEKIIKALSDCGYENITFSDGKILSQNPNILINLGGIAKGYAGQRVCEMLKARGVENAVVSLGGNVTVIGSSSETYGGWNVGIKNPADDSAEIIGTVFVTDKTVSVSGSYERFFEKDGVKYHHIFDRRTGYPSDSDLLSVAVICEDGALADALSTALFVMGYEKALEFYSSGIYRFEAVFCKDGGTVYVTDGIIGDFTPQKSESFKFPQYDQT